ncbi:hypothetical protein [Lysinibacillus sphaericus]|uniref:Uncharacterized protein n=2 Tax=Lysinibacillus sphaericus TaxID=1421 RepID=A0A6H0A1M6_LYSSH|nr:hypothetical protein [Lysinibacillus sphaericus]MBE5085787.1 hypothetical protein [Bacillus thuringiensis]ACA42366.1 hypothetical protein Bsph_p136 [Lysinibacillus sphaericus C3-41]AMO35348.1 hypothetical protein AR327_22935 [Lysinibacillus sphaericus]AMR93049.1 hypothetical protein A1T07_22850 [Lysinibacillus sphaericus]MBG9710609.1 hypothetical protein [Lysinibacillus sphaericus]
MVKQIIVMNGGLIQNIISEGDIDVTIVDYDTEGADVGELMKVNEDDAYVFSPQVEVNIDEVNEILTIIEKARAVSEVASE